MKPSKKKKVFVVDDHPFVREGLKQVLDQQEDLAVCGESATAREALANFEQANPDIIVVDLSLEDRNGVELIKDIRTRSQQVPILVLSMHDETLHAERVLRAGANGYVMKRESPPILLAAIRAVLKGQCYISEAVSGQLLRQEIGRPPSMDEFSVERLSDREFEVFELIGHGHRRSTIAEQLNISVKTVESHCERIKRKLGLRSADELRQHGYLWVFSENNPRRAARKA